MGLTKATKLPGVATDEKISTQNPAHEEHIYQFLKEAQIKFDIEAPITKVLLPTWDKEKAELLKDAFVVAANRVSEPDTRGRYEYINDNQMLFLAELAKKPLSLFEGFNQAKPGSYRQMYVFLPSVAKKEGEIFRQHIELAYEDNDIPADHRETFYHMNRLYLGMCLGNTRMPELVNEKSGEMWNLL